tara:strand:- start:1172 stop:2473 length:1302 start_codon:yes stop_codon:yes gene_type:complete
MDIEFVSSKKSNKTDKGLFEKFVDSDNPLINQKTDNLINLFDSISKYWSSKECGVRDLIRKESMGFIIPWLKKRNTRQILNLSFTKYQFLDEPIINNSNKEILYARPLGIAVHWIAGNVPVLGVISLFQTLLTKNKSIVKVPMRFRKVLPKIFNDLERSDYFKDDNKKLLNILLDAVLIVYAKSDDIEDHKILSKIADLRIAWGGKDAVNAVVGLPKKINARDLVFGPKVSLAIASKELLIKSSDIKMLAQALSNDVFTFDQAGCNSPHNLIIEKTDDDIMDELVSAIKVEFDIKSKKTKFYKDPINFYNVLVKKFLYQSDKSKNAFSSEDYNWNIFLSSLGKYPYIESPIYCRSIFISYIDNLKELGPYLPNNIQSVGLFVAKERKIKLIKLLSNFGVDRFPDLGKMSLYQNPWDGYFPLQEMVRWISASRN